MRFSTAGTIAACVAAACAFQDTSPVFLFSNKDFTSTPYNRVLDPAYPLSQIRQLESAHSVQKALAGVFPNPDVKFLLVVVQPNANAADYASPTAVPHLRKALKKSIDGEPIFVSLNVADVVGEINVDDVIDMKNRYIYLREMDVYENAVLDLDVIKATENGMETVVFRVDFLPFSNDPARRARDIAYHDIILQRLLSQFSECTYAVLYLTTPTNTSLTQPASQDTTGNTPHTGPEYEPEFQDPLHLEIKRRSGFVGRADNSEEYDRRPLFEKYQFFTPGIFMGLMVTLLLLAILSVGIRAISSLEVSYAAFEKEMGPAAHRKA